MIQRGGQHLRVLLGCDASTNHGQTALHNCGSLTQLKHPIFPALDCCDELRSWIADSYLVQNAHLRILTPLDRLSREWRLLQKHLLWGADNQLLPYSGKNLTDYPAAVISAVALPTILKNEFSHELETQVMFEKCNFRYVSKYPNERSICSVHVSYWFPGNNDT
jgi:hypothetical protein